MTCLSGDDDSHQVERLVTQAFKEEVQADDRWVSNSLSKPVLFHTSFTLGASGCPPQVTQGPQQLHAHTGELPAFSFCLGNLS